MAELLILVVIAGVVLLYAVERTRKLRARARQMSGMNERLDVAAAKVDEQRERKQARVRASAELTSVLPAIKRPPLTLPGVPGPVAEPEDEAAAAEPEPGPAAAAAADGTPAADDTPAAADGTRGTADDTPAAAEEVLAGTDDTPATADAGNTPDGTGAEGSPAVQAAPDAADSAMARESSAAEDSAVTAEEVPPEPARVPEGTRAMGRVVSDTTPAPKLQLTSDGTLIMPSVPDQGPAPADETALPAAPPRTRPRASRPRTSQPRTAQPRTSQPRSGQPRSGQSRSGQQSTSQEQANRD